MLRDDTRLRWARIVAAANTGDELLHDIEVYSSHII